MSKFVIYRGSWEEWDVADTLEEARAKIKIALAKYEAWRKPTFNIFQLTETI